MYVRNFGGGPAWIPAAVTTTTGPLSVEYLLDNDRVAKRHLDHVNDVLPDPHTTSGGKPVHWVEPANYNRTGQVMSGSVAVRHRLEENWTVKGDRQKRKLKLKRDLQHCKRTLNPGQNKSVQNLRLAIPWELHQQPHQPTLRHPR